MTADQRLWNEAIAFLETHGGLAEDVITEHMIAVSDDPAVLRRWRQIRRRIVMIRDGEPRNGS